MKKLLTLLLVLTMCFCLASCGEGGNGSTPAPTQEIATTKEIALTKENIGNYVKFDGEFTNGDYKISIVNSATATLEFQAYPVASGKFNNVEITLVGTSTDHTFTYMNTLGNYWHLADASKEEQNELKFTFTLAVDGKFSKNYSVVCLNNTGKLSGSCSFEVKSVSGTFIPD